MDTLINSAPTTTIPPTTIPPASIPPTTIPPASIPPATAPPTTASPARALSTTTASARFTSSETATDRSGPLVVQPLASLGTLADEGNEISEDEDRGSSFARCADGFGTLSHLFFSEDEYDLARAKAICRRCGLADACLAGAIDREEPYGVWGGSLVLDGVPVEFQRKRGRPRKHPKPLLVVEEVPIPDHLVA